jgi:hypothetical protein
VLFKDAWLPELHSKIWGCEDRRSELFCDAQITLAHYVELQKRLKRDRDSPNYQSVGVQSVKLDVLHSLTPISMPAILPGHIDEEQVGPEQIEDAGGSDGLDDELCSFFPATIRYLDLFSLELKHQPPRIPLVCLIRREYDVISKLLDNQPNDNGGSTVVTGQPGTGESWSLFFSS